MRPDLRGIAIFTLGCVVALSGCKSCPAEGPGVGSLARAPAMARTAPAI
ncbi:hypothetical protein KFK14_02995 [Sphingobium phenoxybenzoativorans]|uniref:Uncharacterized protein n=1 Tax=Sphingobium phenoxybenzoativorans TaxID=1592790 RepID=A0A975K8J4_9SPHN|nr:hypothetical protein [Sphingobium phenoxybenzoativorans]QUT06452.1 hypothetical protein KFK14_02995 [Sphingobium phenoxybenzoativorans]